MVSLRDVNWLSRRLRLLMSSEAAVLAADMSSLAARVTALEMIALSLDARLDTIEANYLKRVALPDWPITISAGGIALSLGARTYNQTISAGLGVQPGDDIYVSPSAAVPAGFLVGNASAVSTTQLQIQVLNPLLAIGAS